MNILMTNTAVNIFSVTAPFSEIIVVTMPIRGFLSLCLLSLLSSFLAVPIDGQSSSGALYRGRYIGPITAQKHKVSGEVYAVDSRTIHIRGFSYDGTGPDAFFWTGFTEQPSPQGVIIPNERGTKEVLGVYKNQDITISLPDGLTLRDIKWIAVWCRAYEVNFGDLYIPLNLDYPQPHVIGSLVGQHGVSSGPIVVVDAQTILVPDFTYDGQAPDLHFWVGRGVPQPGGTRIPDETGSDAPLQKADKKTMVLSLPGDLTVFDIDYFGVFLRMYSIDFGHVRVTPGLNVPPSLRMLGIAPQSKLNCEVLHEDSAFEIRWSVVESGETIVFQLVGRMDQGEYMAFGLSGEEDRSVMVGGDAMIGWFDQTSGRGNVVDYHLGSKSVCQGDQGSCPDVRLKEGANNVRLLSAASVNGFTILTFQRKLRALDPFDKRILTNQSQPIIWALGTLKNGLAGYHATRSDDFSIDFGRSPKWNCPEPLTEPEFVENTPPNPITTTPTPPPKLYPLTEVPDNAQSDSDTSTSGHSNNGADLANPTAWTIPPIQCDEPEDGVYYVHLGPSGRKKIFRAITGKQDVPSNVWYINGLLMPEIYLVRNRNYTFVVQGGDGNGFYITSDSVGDFAHRKQMNVYAGVELDSLGNSKPTALGKLCRWIESGSQPAEFFASYAAYQRSLTLDCSKGHSGVLHFTPDKSIPNLVYYQSYSMPNMGWKIHIVDECNKKKESLPVALALNDVSQSMSPTAPPQSLHQDQHVEESRISQQTFLPNLIVNGLSQASQPNYNLKESHSPVAPIHPIENTYIIDTSSPMGGPNMQPFDSRLIFKGRPLEAQNSVRQPVVAIGPGGNSFQFPQSHGLYQIAIENSGGETNNGVRPTHQNIYQPPTGFQMQMPDNHFLRRTGQAQAPSMSNVYNKYPPPSYVERQQEGYYETKPEYYQPGPTRPPLVSHSAGRYENLPLNHGGPTMIYATTVSPQRRTFMSHDNSDLIMRGPPTPSNSGRGQNGPRRPPPPQPQMDMQQPLINSENVHVKYIENHSGSAIQILPSDGRAPPVWAYTHARNLPKRESRPVYTSKRKLRESLRRVSRDYAGIESIFSGKNKSPSNHLANHSLSKHEQPNAKRQTQGDTSKHDDPVLESFGLEPVFRPSTLITESFNGSLALQQSQHYPRQPLSIMRYNDYVPVVASSPPHLHSFQNVLQHEPPSNVALSRTSPGEKLVIKLGLREFLRQASLIPQLPIQTRGTRVREFVKVSWPIKSIGLRQGWPVRQVQKGHKMFRPRKDQIVIAPPAVFSAVSAAVERKWRPEASGNTFKVFFKGDDVPSETKKINSKELLWSPEEEEENEKIPRESTTATATNNGEQDKLELTLLTDVWQIINQQGISLPTKIQSPILQNRPQIPRKIMKNQKTLLFNYRHPFLSRSSKSAAQGIDAGLKEEKGNEDAEKDLVQVSELGFLLV